MTHKYPYKEWELPSVTTICGDAVSQPWAAPWGAKMTVEWIRQNCPKPKRDHYLSGDDYAVSEEDLLDAKKNFREVSETALAIGSDTHSAIEEWLVSGREPLDPRPEVLSAFVAFLEFWDAHKMTAIKVEHTVYGDCWAGTLDYYGWFNGKLYVIDFKTSKQHDKNTHGPQIAAYRSRVNAKVDGCGILRLDKETGLPDWKDYSALYRKHLAEFNWMLELYMSRHPRIAKKAGWTKPF